MADLEKVHAVEARIQALVALVIRGGMEHLRIYPARVVAVKKLSDEEEILPDAVREAAKPFEKVEIKAVSHVEADTVYAEILDPEAHRVEQMIDDGGVAEVQLYEVVVALPALVP